MPITELNRATETLRAHLIPTVRISALARHAGVSRQYISSVLRGERRASAKLLDAAAELGIPVTTDPAADAANRPAVVGAAGVAGAVAGAHSLAVRRRSSARSAGGALEQGPGDEDAA